MMGIHDGFDDSQAKAGAAGLIGTRFIRPVEPLEQIGDCIWGDRGTVIDYLYDGKLRIA